MPIRNRRITVNCFRKVSDGDYGSFAHGLDSSIDLEEGEDVKTAIRNEHEFLKEIVEELIDEDLKGRD